MISSIFIVPAAVIALVVLIVAGIKGESKNGGEDVIKNVYTYLVLFATLMMIIGGSVGAFMAIADIIAPAPYYQSFEDFRRWGVEEKPYTDRESTGETKPTEEELRERYDAMVLAQKELQIERAKNNLVKSFGWIVVPLPIFIYFQRRLARKEN